MWREPLAGALGVSVIELLAGEAVSREEFKERARRALGVEAVLDYYGMAEQTGCIYLECPCGHLTALASKGAQGVASGHCVPARRVYSSFIGIAAPPHLGLGALRLYLRHRPAGGERQSGAPVQPLRGDTGGFAPADRLCAGGPPGSPGKAAPQAVQVPWKGRQLEQVEVIAPVALHPSLHRAGHDAQTQALPPGSPGADRLGDLPKRERLHGGAVRPV